MLLRVQPLSRSVEVLSRPRLEIASRVVRSTWGAPEARTHPVLFRLRSRREEYGVKSSPLFLSVLIQAGESVTLFTGRVENPSLRCWGLWSYY